MEKRRNWILIIAIIIGIVCASVAGYYIHKQVSSAEKTVQVIVPSEIIEPLTVIDKNQIKTINIPAKAADQYTVTQASAIEGNMSEIRLYPDKMIDSRSINPKEAVFGGRQKVGIFIDPARSADVQAGSIVDVYWLNQDKTVGPGTPIATGAIVVKVMDENCTVLSSGNKSGSTSQRVENGTLLNSTKPAKYVYLLVKPEEVKLVINGGIDNKTIALSEKSVN